MRKILLILSMFICSGKAETILALDNYDDFKIKMLFCFKNFHRLHKSTASSEWMHRYTEVQDIVVHILVKVGISTDLATSLGEKIMNYYNLVPYHNVCHGIMVAYNTDMFLVGAKNHGSSTNYDINKKKALILAALVHDIAHTGYTNGYGRFALDKETINFENDKSYIKDPICIFEATKKDSSVVSNGCKLKDNAFSDDTKIHGDVTHRTQTLEKVLEIYGSYFQPSTKMVYSDTNPKRNIYDVFCGSAEGQHAVYAYNLFKDIEPFKSHINLMVVAILSTNMAVYQFMSGAPFFERNETTPQVQKIDEDYYGAVHLGDILTGSAELDFLLRNQMLKGLIQEFKEETSRYEPIVNKPPPGNYMKSWFSDHLNFIDSQIGFVDNWIAGAVKQNKEGDHQAVPPANQFFNQILGNVSKINAEYKKLKEIFTRYKEKLQENKSIKLKPKQDIENQKAKHTLEEETGDVLSWLGIQDSFDKIINPKDDDPKIVPFNVI